MDFSIPSRRGPREALSIAAAAATAALMLLAALPAPRPASARDDSAGPDTLGGYVVTRELLLETGRGDRIKRIFVSEPRNRVAVTVDCGHDGYVWVEGLGEQKRVRGFVSLQFSPDGSRVAWMDSEDNDKAKVSVDGVEIGEYDFVIGEKVTFSPVGNRYGFLAVKLKKRKLEYVFPVIDGQEGRRWDSITGPADGPYLIFSPDGSRWVFFAADDQKYRAVIDGEPGPKFDNTAHVPVFSDDGTKVAYAGVRDGLWYVMENDREHGPYPEATQPAICPGSGDLAFGVNGEEGGYVVRDGSIVGRHYRVMDPIFSLDGRRFAYWASDKVSGTTFVVCDSVQGPGSYSVATPRFNRDNVLFYTSFLDSTGHCRVYYADDRRLGEMCGVFDHTKFTTGSGGARTAYLWRDDNQEIRVVVDGREYGGQTYATSVEFSPDGSRFSYAARVEGGWCPVLDGRKGRVYGYMCSEPCFSPDGEHTAFVAAEKEDERRLVIDGEPGRKYWTIKPDYAEFEDDGSLVYYGIEKRKRLYRITLRPVAGRESAPVED